MIRRPSSNSRSSASRAASSHSWNVASARPGHERSAGTTARLELGNTHSPLERQADAVADRVTRMPAPSPESGGGSLPGSQTGQLDGASIQRDGGTGTAMPVGLSSKVHSLRSTGGQPLHAEIRDFFEPRFGVDLSAVRVYTDARAGATARSVQARAFTIGNDVVFGAGEYQPHTSAGQRLLAHELAHAIQQSNPIRRSQCCCAAHHNHGIRSRRSCPARSRRPQIC